MEIGVQATVQQLGQFLHRSMLSMVHEFFQIGLGRERLNRNVFMRGVFVGQGQVLTDVHCLPLWKATANPGTSMGLIHRQHHGPVPCECFRKSSLVTTAVPWSASLCPSKIHVINPRPSLKEHLWEAIRSGGWGLENKWRPQGAPCPSPTSEMMPSMSCAVGPSRHQICWHLDLGCPRPLER
jgi:hypothetical protein